MVRPRSRSQPFMSSRDGVRRRWSSVRFERSFSRLRHQFRSPWLEERRPCWRRAYGRRRGSGRSSRWPGAVVAASVRASPRSRRSIASTSTGAPPSGGLADQLSPGCLPGRSGTLLLEQDRAVVEVLVHGSGRWRRSRSRRWREPRSWQAAAVARAARRATLMQPRRGRTRGCRAELLARVDRDDQVEVQSAQLIQIRPSAVDAVGRQEPRMVGSSLRPRQPSRSSAAARRARDDVEAAPRRVAHRLTSGTASARRARGGRARWSSTSASASGPGGSVIPTTLRPAVAQHRVQEAAAGRGSLPG